MKKYKGSDNGFYNGYVINENGPKQDNRSKTQKQIDAERRRKINAIDDFKFKRELALVGDKDFY